MGVLVRNVSCSAAGSRPLVGAGGNHPPGLRVSGQGVDAKVVTARGGVSGGACSTVIVVDYVRIERINDVPPSTIGAMEFYPSQISAPMQSRSPCGTIMIWTKR